MRLHTSLTQESVRLALRRAHLHGQVATDVTFLVLTECESRTRQRAFEVRLVARNPHSLPDGYTDQYGQRLRTRRTGPSGLSASWHEWGWFIAHVFRLDPDAVFGPYRGYADFMLNTGYKFDLEPASDKQSVHLSAPAPGEHGKTWYGMAPLW